ncbi:MAG: (d)CMP kinase, partial [Rhodospirillales bacterium]
MIIAIDGPAAAGKGTLAKRLAAHYSLALLDTGLLYRAVGYKVLALEQGPEDTNIATEVAEELMPEDLESPNLRNDEVAQAASKVSAVPGVRAALLEFQQDFARNPPGDVKGAILD